VGTVEQEGAPVCRLIEAVGAAKELKKSTGIIELGPAKRLTKSAVSISQLPMPAAVALAVSGKRRTPKSSQSGAPGKGGVKWNVSHEPPTKRSFSKNC